MSKSRLDKIREVLMPREKVFYDAKQHPAAFVFPVFIILVAVFISIPIRWEFSFIPSKHLSFFNNSLETLRSVYFGVLVLFMGLIVLLNTRKAGKEHFHLVTNIRVIEKKGKKEKNLQYTLLHEISHIKKKGSMFQALLFTGNVFIQHKNDETKNILITNVTEPKKFKKAVEMAVKRFAATVKEIQKTQKLKSKGVPKKLENKDLLFHSNDEENKDENN